MKTRHNDRVLKNKEEIEAEGLLQGEFKTVQRQELEKYKKKR